MVVKARLLKELLTESNAFGYLLGGSGVQGGVALNRSLYADDVQADCTCLEFF